MESKYNEYCIKINDEEGKEIYVFHGDRRIGRLVTYRSDTPWRVMDLNDREVCFTRNFREGLLTLVEEDRQRLEAMYRQRDEDLKKWERFCKNSNHLDYESLEPTGQEIHGRLNTVVKYKSEFNILSRQQEFVPEDFDVNYLGQRGAEYIFKLLGNQIIVSKVEPKHLYYSSHRVTIQLDD